MRHAVQGGRPARAYGKWISRIPKEYRLRMLDLDAEEPREVSTDPNCLAQLQDYRSLMPMAQEARKPMFLLPPGDGAFGGHQAAVTKCYGDFKALTAHVMARADGAALGAMLA